MGFTYVTVTGDYVNPDGSPVLHGNVRFIPTAPLVNSVEPSETVPMLPVRAQVVNGTITVSLAATDDPGTTPADALYRVEERLGQDWPNVYYIEVPRLGGPIDLDTHPRTQDAPIGGVNLYAPLVHTHDVGDLTATGTPSASTYLRGDGSWATPAGGGADPGRATALALILGGI